MPQKNERMDERTCFDLEENEPFLTFSSPVSGGGIFNFYLTFFFSGFESKEEYRVFLDTEKPEVAPLASSGWWPSISAQEEVFVNMYFVATHAGDPAYSFASFESIPHSVPEFTQNDLVFGRHSLLRIKINNVIYDVETYNITTAASTPATTIFNLDIL
jgi:hypothetical protein